MKSTSLFGSHEGAKLFLSAFLMVYLAAFSLPAGATRACRDSLAVDPTSAVLEPQEWLERYKGRYSEDPRQFQGRIVEGFADGAKAETERAELRRLVALQNQMVRDGRKSPFEKNKKFERLEKLRNKQMSTASRLLEHRGIRHLAVQHRNVEVISQFVVLPDRSSQWGLFAKDLFENHGTLIEIGTGPRLHFTPSANVLYIPVETFVNEEIPEIVEYFKAALKNENVSEVEVTTRMREDEANFLLGSDGVSHFLGGLRFVTIRTPVGAPISFFERFSYRIGSVRGLPPDVKAYISAMVSAKSANGKTNLGMGLRNAAGQWVFAGAHSIPDNQSYSFGALYRQIKDSLPNQPQPLKAGLPDLFLFEVGRNGLSSQEIAQLKQMAQDGIVGLNSVSYVLATDRPGIYQIHSEQVGARTVNIDLTPYGDLLVRRIDRSLSIQNGNRDYDPFPVWAEDFLLITDSQGHKQRVGVPSRD